MAAGKKKKLENNDSQIFSIPWPFLHHSSSRLDPIVLVFTIVQLSQEYLGWNTIDKSLVYTRKRNWETAGESLSPQPGAPCASQALNTSSKNRGRWCDQEVRRALNFTWTFSAGPGSPQIHTALLITRKHQFAFISETTGQFKPDPVSINWNTVSLRVARLVNFKRLGGLDKPRAGLGLFI